MKIYDDLVEDLRLLQFGLPVTHVYNPLIYARAPHLAYLSRWGRAPKEVLFIGMNPGPWGMAQTGVPFGEVCMVRDWLGIDAAVGRPDREHPQRPIEGFACKRSEVSGKRVWGWARDTFGTPDVFFRRFFIANYCPLTFMEDSGRNRTPDKLPAAERDPLLHACDRALRRVVEHYHPRWVVGFGGFAEARARAALEGLDVTIGRVLHPSPASPLANDGWGGKVTKELAALGIKVP